VRHQNANRQSAIGNRQFSKAILLETPIESASAQAQRLRGLARIAIVSGQRFFDQERFDFFETHLLHVPRFAAASRQTKIGCADLSILRHKHCTLDDVIELPDVSGKPVL
jgi:hypothetical protein